MQTEKEQKSNVILSESSQQAIATFQAALTPNIIESIIEERFSEKGSFLDLYQELTNYRRKFAVAYELAIDGRFEQQQKLLEYFIRPKDDIGPEEEQMAADLKAVLMEKGVIKPSRKEMEGLKKFFEDVAEGKTMDAQEFRKLVGLFDSSRAVDILFRCRPEYRGLPVDKVKSIMADYLGNFLQERRGFNVNDLEVGLAYLSDPTFQEMLVENMKDSCIAVHTMTKNQNCSIADADIVLGYIDDLAKDLAKFDYQEVRDAISQVRGYYEGIFNRIQRPETMVATLKAGRSFPDFPQQINTKEIADKKRILIADGMGMGKSASPIMAKELLGIGTALVVAPKNVIDTWRGYLSDQRSDRGEQIGYFKEGCAPRVLVLEDMDDLMRADVSAYDYVLVSQEKLNERYIEGLEAIDFGMLVVDEIHKLKNLTEGKRASNLLRLAQKIEGEDKYLVLLSGTPVPNKVSDLAMILKLLYPEKFEQIDDKELVRSIIYGDAGDIRSLLVPRMQMKSMAEAVDMPKLNEQVVRIELSPQEREVYEVLLEEDEITATQKLRALRLFLLNPDVLDFSSPVESSKIQAVRERLLTTFSERDKVVMFVNGYIEGVIRGERNIIGRLGLPPEVSVEVIEGHVESSARFAIQQRLNRSVGRKMLLLVSGMTADVGVDFSGGEAVDLYNEPWTMAEKRQELHRVCRPSIYSDMTRPSELLSRTYVCIDTVEEGIHRFIQIKDRAIEKLIKGIPPTEVERTLVKKNEKSQDPNLEVNPELADYYFSAWDRMMRIFNYTREIGENNFITFLEKYGGDYANCYADLGSRSFQSNTGRVMGTMIGRFIQEADQDVSKVRILDVASGPEVLRKHISEAYQDRITSLDINPAHFQSPGGNRVVGSFLKLPFSDGSFDYANLSLALHYTKLIPSQGEYERLELLAEIIRILKVGGRASVNLIYTLDLKDEERFKVGFGALGLRVVEQYSGDIVVGSNYKSKVITLEKEREVDLNTDALVNQLSKEDIRGLKFKKKKARLRNSRKIIKQFELAGETIPIAFNKEDYEILKEEEGIIDQGENLKSKYRTVQQIPREEVLNNGFIRFFNGKKYVLFKKLEQGSGGVVIR